MAVNCRHGHSGTRREWRFGGTERTTSIFRIYETPPVGQFRTAGDPVTSPAASPDLGPVQSRPFVLPTSSEGGNIPLTPGSGGGAAVYSPSMMGVGGGLILAEIVW